MLFYLDNFESVAPNSQTAGNNRRQQMLQNGNLNPRQRERIKQRQGITDAELDQLIKQRQNGGQQKRERGINENYARELMELHTLGVDGRIHAEGHRRSRTCVHGLDDRRSARLSPGRGQ
jgi:uncharacterized protein (DUF1800 family)